MTITAENLKLDGELLTPGASGYDAARTIWNAMVDRRPELIARTSSVRDVVSAVRVARERDLEIGVKCGGHNAAGFAVPDGGLMIDLTPLGGVRVDPVRRRAWVQGGALLGALDAAAQRHGLATTAGNVSHTGVGGLTLGGGMGWLARQYGLACDNVVSFQVVTADGDVVRAGHDEHPDLYWGLRGGGGNFGIVTEFEFQLHPVGTRSLVAEYTVGPARAAAAMRHWRDLLAGAPRQATFTASAPGDGSVTLGFVWVGEGSPDRLLSEMPDARVTTPTYLQLQRRDDSTGRHAMRRYAKGHYLRHLPDTAIAAFLDPSPAGAGSTGAAPAGAGSGGAAPASAGSSSAAPASAGSSGAGRQSPVSRGLQAYGGAIGDIPDDDTAFAHRDTMFEFGTGTRWTDPAEDQARMAAARRSGAVMEPFAGGVYVNALNDEGAAGVRRAYPAAKLARLTAVKDRYDPHNVFHLNHNIRPSAMGGSR